MVLTLATIFCPWMTHLFFGKIIGEEYDSPEHITGSNLTSTLNALTQLLIRTVTAVRYLYVDLHILSGILTLWVISCDFRDGVQKAFQWPSQGMSDGKINFIKQYKSISRLSRMFSKVCGYTLFSCILFYCIYYSVCFSELLMPIPAVQNVYVMKFLLANISIFRFGVGFSLRVYT